LRDIESALGNGLKQGPSDEEAVEMYAKARRSVVATRAISAGTLITRDMLTTKRPGHGIKPKFIEALVGRVASIDIDDDEVLTWEML
jgi:sialic acid synthase SpsE